MVTLTFGPRSCYVNKVTRTDDIYHTPKHKPNPSNGLEGIHGQTDRHTHRGVTGIGNLLAFVTKCPPDNDPSV